MKPSLQFTLSLAMVLFMAGSCVSSPPPASLEPQAAPQVQTAAASNPEAPTQEAPAETPAETVVTPQTPAEAPAEPAEASPSSVPAAPSPDSDTSYTSSVPSPDPVSAPPSSVPTPEAPGTASARTTSTASQPTQPAQATRPSQPAQPAQPTQPTKPAQVASASQEKPRQVGEVVYTEGTVSVHRAGKSITLLDIGDVVYAYDVVMTGPASLAQVDLGAGSPGGAFLRLSENTAFYFDTKELSGEQRRTVLQLLSGSIAVKVEKLAGGSFSVASDTAVLGVRGTEFVVDTIPDGTILVSCVEGAVAVQAAEGQEATARPGRAVTGRKAGLETANVAVSELARFRSGWRQDSFAGFAGQAVQYSSGYAAILDAQREAFDAALASLRAQEAILHVWREARNAGKVPRFADWITEKKAVGGILFENLKVLFTLERPYYRLLELRSLHEVGTGVGIMQDGKSTMEFFSRFDARYAFLADGMASIREALLLFAWASAGSPLGDFFGAKAEGLGSGTLFLEGDDW